MVGAMLPHCGIGFNSFFYFSVKRGYFSFSAERRWEKADFQGVEGCESAFRVE